MNEERNELRGPTGNASLPATPISRRKSRIETVISKNGKKYKRQLDRIIVRVSPLVWDVVEPVFTGRRGGPSIDTVACELTLIETMRLLSEEPLAPPGVRNHQMFITPSERLLERAKRLYIGPHVLCRAAAIKIAQNILEEDNPTIKRGRGRPRKELSYAGGPTHALDLGVGGISDGTDGTGGMDGDDGLEEEEEVDWDAAETRDWDESREREGSESVEAER